MNRKIVFSKCDINEVTETLDSVLNLRDEYLFATMFKGCKWGFDRGEVCRFSKKSLLQQLDSEADEKSINLGKMLGAFLGRIITWQALLFIILWGWAVRFYCLISGISFSDNSYLKGYFPLWVMMSLVFLVAFYMAFWSRSCAPIYRENNRDMLIWHKKENRSREMLYHIKSKFRRRSTWHAVICVILLWVLTMSCIREFRTIVLQEEVVDLFDFYFGNKMYSLAVLITVYVIYKAYLGGIRAFIHDKTAQDELFWENRTGHTDHVWTKPLFFGGVTRFALKIDQRRSHGEARRFSDHMLDQARDLSWLRCLCQLSEEIKQFTKEGSGENSTIEIKEDDGCNDPDFDGEYTIRVITEEYAGTNEDTVIPVESEKKARSFTVPYVIGNRIVQNYHQNGNLDLSILDDVFAETREYFKTSKDKIKSSLVSYNVKETAAVFRYLNREDLFKEKI